MAGIIQDESIHDPARGFPGGYEMETLSLGLPFMGAFLDPGAWRRDFTRKLGTYDRMAGMRLVGEDMPQLDNCVTVHAYKKGGHGMPVTVVTFTGHPHDLAMCEHAFWQGEAVSDVAGARETFRDRPYPATHKLGTNRMSERAQDGLVNRLGQTHDSPNSFVSDGSQFTSGGAGNPTLTAVALAIRQAGHIADRMSRGEHWGLRVLRRPIRRPGRVGVHQASTATACTGPLHVP